MTSSSPESAPDLVPSFVPALIVVLAAAERAKGSALTEDEVLSLRDGAVCMMVPLSVEQRLAESRGYDDLDPEQVWPQWQQYRAESSGV